jgi:hypothetical protein
MYVIYRLEKGKNHLIFNLMHENMMKYKIIDETLGRAMVAGIGYTKSTYRRKFDISLPALSTSLDHFEIDTSKPR